MKITIHISETCSLFSRRKIQIFLDVNQQHMENPSRPKSAQKKEKKSYAGKCLENVGKNTVKAKKR